MFTINVTLAIDQNFRGLACLQIGTEHVCSILKIKPRKYKTKQKTFTSFSKTNTQKITKKKTKKNIC
jgi:hypothetical protein